jgi:hypothetical protein
MKKAIFLFSALVFFSCGKKEKVKVKAEKGGIDIVSNVYFNASKGLNDMKTVVVSKLNYKGDTIVELVPNIDVSDFIDHIYIIKDSLAFSINEESTQQIMFSNLPNMPSIPVNKKEQGAIFRLNYIPHFNERYDINDTILFKKEYKRFSVTDNENLTMYYVHPTDTILPYAIYPYAGDIYGGRVERVDMYNRKKDIFISVQLLMRNTWDKEAQDIFDFNNFLEKRK